MAKCIVCGDSYADQLRRCPYCGEDPDDSSNQFTPRSAPELSDGVTPGKRKPQVLIGLALGGIVALIIAIALPSGFSGDEEAGPIKTGSKKGNPKSPKRIQPKAEQQGFGVTGLRIVEGRLLVTGTCQPDETAQITVNGAAAVVEPDGVRWHAWTVVSEVEVVAVGMKGDRRVVTQTPPAPEIAPAGSWRLRSHADGMTVHTGRLRVEVGMPDGTEPREAEVQLPDVANIIEFDSETFMMYRAPPGLVFLRVTPEGTYTFLRKHDGQEMVLIPAGIAYRGMGKEPPHGPRDLVRTRAYLIDRTEVTCAQYSRFLHYMARSNNSMLRHPQDPGVRLRPAGWKDLEPPAGLADHPVKGVNWYAAVAYAKWVGGSLPTEAQWERAAAGPLGLAYPWGTTLDRRRCRAEGDGTVPADSMPGGRSPYGLLHMSGNVREWCEDRFDPRWYEQGSVIDPRGPVDPRHRVVRGGSYQSGEGTHRAQMREHLTPQTNGLDVGFRVAWRWRDG